MNYDLTKGSVLKKLIMFSLPYLLSCFLQTFYGLADLFVIGMYNGAGDINAVSVGSQVTHMLTLIIVGIAMGTTVLISHTIGTKDERTEAKAIGNTVSIFAIVAVLLTVALLVCTKRILHILSVPGESYSATRKYLTVCFIGIPFITAYNVISSIFRGMGDTRHPMYFVGIAGVFNVALDFLLVGFFKLGAFGAAIATVVSQGISVVIALLALKKISLGIAIKKSDFILSRSIVKSILVVGVPIAVQDFCVQISFLIITKIANSRGVDIAAAVGIVEKIISFIFLVPSSMLSSVSAIAAQNAGAGLHGRGKRVLGLGCIVCTFFGAIFIAVCNIFSKEIVSLFTSDGQVVMYGEQYLRSYVWDCVFAGIHFCFSGYFCAYNKSMISFLHNIVAISLIRIPGAFYTSWKYPDTLFPMGMVAPLGSILSSIICICIFLVWQKKSIEFIDTKGYNEI